MKIKKVFLTHNKINLLAFEQFKTIIIFNNTIQVEVLRTLFQICKSCIIIMFAYTLVLKFKSSLCQLDLDTSIDERICYLVVFFMLNNKHLCIIKMNMNF